MRVQARGALGDRPSAAIPAGRAAGLTPRERGVALLAGRTALGLGFGTAVGLMVFAQNVTLLSFDQTTRYPMLVLVAVRMPTVFLLLFTLVDVSLVLNLLGIIQSSENMSKAAGWALMAVAAVVVYLFLGSASHVTVGKDFPMGRPILHA